MKIAQRLYIDLLKKNHAGILKFWEGGGSKQWLKTPKLIYGCPLPFISVPLGTIDNIGQKTKLYTCTINCTPVVFLLVYMLHKFKLSNLDRPTLKMNARWGLAIHLVISIYFQSKTLGGWIFDPRAVHGRGAPLQYRLRLIPQNFFYKLCIAIQ